MEFSKKVLSPLSLIPINYFMSSNKDDNNNQIDNFFISGVICDKSAIFKEYRNSYQNRFFHFLEKDVFKDSNNLLKNSSIFNEYDDDKKEHLLSSTNIELKNLKDKSIKNNYLEIFHNTEELYKELNNDMNSLKKKQLERIKTKVYESENKQIDKEIEKIIKSMTQKVKSCEINIKEISSIPDSYLSNIHCKIKDNIKTTLSQKFHDFSCEFRKNNQQFMEDLQKLGTKSSIIDDEDTSLKDFDRKHSNNFFFMQDEENSELKIRNECINSLLSSINELTSIVKDLQTVVQEQGTILDRIDYNIDIAMDNTQKAYGHINEANKLQKQSCFRNTVLIIMFIIFFEFILLINKYL
jgi:syntaxin 16